MNITKDVISDLLPLYVSDECSPDTKLLIDEYLKANPEFAEEVKNILHNPFPSAIPNKLNKGDEMYSLTRTKQLIRRRTYLMALAIFCTLTPFSFLYIGGKIYWLFTESPASAFFYGSFGIFFWIAFFWAKRRTKEL
jgi:hypothetical protein